MGRKLPGAPGERVAELPRLSGGLNLWDLDYRMDADQSPEMKNLWWKDGALGCRPGQVWVTAEEEGGRGYACFRDLFWGHAFLHIGDGLWCGDEKALSRAEEESPTRLRKLLSGVPEERGTFFRFGDALYYKNRGGYFRIAREEDGSFSAGAVVAYCPVTHINLDPVTAAGDLYQPRNRLTGTRTVWYTAAEGVREYRLPVKGPDRVEADGAELEEGKDYTADLAAGTVTFAQAPAFHVPAEANTVRITFTKEDPDERDSVMDCPYAAVYGGDRTVCVVVGGCRKQPNAYFWSGSHTAVDPGYFPVEQYNFAGDTEEPITGFGRQQAMLVVFKERSIGRAGFETAEMATGRVLLSMPYTPINSTVGCDLPWTIRLAENNLVFCNRTGGVYLLLDSTAALENNVLSLSRNVNGGDQRPGLLAAVRRAETVCAFDDGSRYWLAAGGEAYVWDHALSSCRAPSWFYFTGIGAEDFFRQDQRCYHLSASGRVTALREVYADYGGPIHKVYRFAAQTLGGYDRLKDVLSVLFVVRSDTNSVIHVTYLTDYEQRSDLTPIRAYSWALAPRNLQHRFLGVVRFATVARRRPGTRHVRHFSMRLENNDLATDMSVISAQIIYRYQGRER